MVEGGGLSGFGHLGDAYGLRSIFLFDPAAKNGIVVLAGGTSSDPEAQRGRHSAMARFEERIMAALYRRAIGGKGT
jgi:hypothetical protein